MQPGETASERTFIETARRAQIVASAIDTIAEAGYAQASFARIAERGLLIVRRDVDHHSDDVAPLFGDPEVGGAQALHHQRGVGGGE